MNILFAFPCLYEFTWRSIQLDIKEWFKSYLLNSLEILKVNMHRHKIILSFEERKRLADFFVLLIKIDKRNAKNTRHAKDRKIKAKCYNKGPPSGGSCLLVAKRFILIRYQ